MQLGKNRGIDSATSVCTHVLMREDESETTPKERVMGGEGGGCEGGREWRTEKRSNEDEGKIGPLHRSDAPLSIFLEII